MVDKTLEVLTADLAVNLRRYEKGFQKAVQTTDKRLAAIEGRIDKGAAKIERSAGRMADKFNQALTGIAVGLAVRQAGNLADAWTEAENKIRSAELAFGGELASAADVAKIANDTRTQLEPTVELYQRLARAGGRLGKSQETVARATETVNKSLKAGGASQSEQNSTLLQLSQALQSGQLMGEELRSIRENAPLLAEAIADAMGVSVGALRDLGREGEITADIIFDAITNGADKIEAQFAVTVPTIADSFTILRNRAAEFIGEVDDATEASARLSQFIIVASQNLDLLAASAVVAAASIGGAKLGLAMSAFVTSLTASNALMPRAVRQLGALNTAALVAKRGVRGLSSAFVALGGPWALVFGGIALALLQMSKAAAKAKQDAADFAETMDRANEVLERTEQYVDRQTLRGIGDDADYSIPFVGELADKLGDVTDALNDATIAKFAQDMVALQNSISEASAKVDEFQEKRRKQVVRRNRASILSFGRTVGDDISVPADKQLGEARAKLNGLKFRQQQIAISIGGTEGFSDALLSGDIGAAKAILKKRLEDMGAGATVRVKTDADDDKAAKRAARDAERLQERLTRAYRASFEAKRQEIERTLIEDLAAIEAAALSEDEKRKASLQAEMIYREAIKQLDDKQREERARADAEEKARLDALADRQLENALQVASIKGDGAEVERLSRELNIRERISELRGLDASLSEAAARAQAVEEENQVAAAEAIARKNFELERELDFKLLLAQEAGNRPEVERLEREIALLRTRNDLIARGASPDDADRQATREQDAIDGAQVEGIVRDAAKGGFRAAIDGEFGDYLAGKLERAADHMFDNAIDTLLDALLNDIDFGSIFGGGAGGGILGGLGSVFAGFFDKGGTIPRGQFGIVGERGPELVNGPARITGRADTARLMRQRPDATRLAPASVRGGDTVYNDNRVIDARGTDPAVISRLEQALERVDKSVEPRIKKQRKREEQGLA